MYVMLNCTIVHNLHITEVSGRGVVDSVVGLLHSAVWVRIPLRVKKNLDFILSLSPHKVMANQRVVSCLDITLILEPALNRRSIEN